MDKQQLEIRLGAALEHGFVPAGISMPEGHGKFVVIDKEGEDNRITIAFRTAAERGQYGSVEHMHTHQFIYSLEEVAALLEEYRP